MLVGELPVFDRFIEFGRSGTFRPLRPLSPWRGGAVALIAHVAIGGIAVWATLPRSVARAAPRLVIMPWPDGPLCLSSARSGRLPSVASRNFVYEEARTGESRRARRQTWDSGLGVRSLGGSTVTAVPNSRMPNPEPRVPSLRPEGVPGARLYENELLEHLGVSGSVYLALLLKRLTRAENRKNFYERPIPTIRGGALLGQRLDLEPTSELERVSVDSVEVINSRLKRLEDIVQRLDDRIERREDAGHH
jgi:hypothetical protein